jgi:parallel beta-helix repeat protein
VRDYKSDRQGAAIQPAPRASGWVVRNISALHNSWAGLLVADGMRILGGHYNDNDQLGIGGNAATGIVLDGLDDDPAALDGPELARNHTIHASCDFESGGMKWDIGQVTVRNAYVHDNDCRGLWADINAHDALIEHNVVEDNRAEGILYEISQDAVIRNNRIYRNGLRASGWYWDGGIVVASSSNVEIYGNRLSGNYDGITGTQQDRPDSTPPSICSTTFRFTTTSSAPPATGAPHGRGRRRRRQPGGPRHHLQPQHHPVGHLPVAVGRPPSDSPWVLAHAAYCNSPCESECSCADACEGGQGPLESGSTWGTQ